MLKIDNSQLQEYITCPKCYQNKYIFKLAKQKDDISEMDRNFGSCIHSGLEKLYSGKSLVEAKECMRTMVAVEGEKIKTPLNGEKLLEEYWTYWNKSINELDNSHFTVLDVEKLLEIPITDDLIWQVKVDTVVKNNAGIWSLEHKTTGDIAYNYFLQFDPNMQISGQCEAIRQVYGQCSGVIIDVLGCGQRERKYLDKPAGFWTNFKREIVNRSEDQLLDFKKDVITWSNKLKVEKDFPRNTKACHQYRGCTYRQLCLSVDDENVRDVMYMEVDPFAYLKKEG